MSHCNYSEWAPVPLSIKSKCVKALMDFCIRLYNWQKGKIWKRTEEKIFLCSREVLYYRCVERLELKPAYFFCFKFQPLYTGFGEALLSERLPLSIVKIDLPALITFHSPFFLSCASSCWLLQKKGKSCTSLTVWGTKWTTEACKHAV